MGSWCSKKHIVQQRESPALRPVENPVAASNDVEDSVGQSDNADTWPEDEVDEPYTTFDAVNYLLADQCVGLVDARYLESCDGPIEARQNVPPEHTRYSPLVLGDERHEGSGARMPESVVNVVSYAWAPHEPAERWEIDGDAMKSLTSQGATGASAAAALRVAARAGALEGDAAVELAKQWIKEHKEAGDLESAVASEFAMDHPDPKRFYLQLVQRVLGHMFRCDEYKDKVDIRVFWVRVPAAASPSQRKLLLERLSTSDSRHFLHPFRTGLDGLVSEL